MANIDLATDEAAIRQNVKYIEEGWNTKSGALLATPFARDADYVAVNGRRAKGREMIGQVHQRLFDTAYRESTINLAVEQIRFLRPDIALVHVGGHNTTKQGETTREWDVMITAVMTKNAEKWEIPAFHNTIVDETPAFQRAS